MRAPRALLLALLLALLPMAPAEAAARACPTRPPWVELTEADAGRSVTVRCGLRIAILAQNYTGGASLSSAGSVVRPDGIKRGGTPMLSKDSYLFTSLTLGVATLYIHRGLPFGLPSPVPEPFDFSVTVKVVR